MHPFKGPSAELCRTGRSTFIINHSDGFVNTYNEVFW